MKKAVWLFVSICALASGGTAVAEMCATDAVPAATLLLPYFEVDWSTPRGEGVTTVFSINNASSAPVLAHVVLWTDWSAPTIDFELFLTGYDVAAYNMWDLFDGLIGITADDQSDPTDAVSPHAGIYADNPLWEGNFLNCNNFFPFFNNPMIRGTALDRLRNGHSGAPVTSLGGACLGDDHGDDIARGYVTIDSVSECSLVLELSEIGYFVDGGLGIANDNNQLWGDYYILDWPNAFAMGDTLVHIEADPTFDGLPTNYTFYGRYGLGDGRDDREPLGTTWATRYLNGGTFDGGTEFLVWRDSTVSISYSGSGFTCGVGPDWFPLNETEVIVFDEEEDAVEICYFAGGLISPPDAEDPSCFPYETGRYSVGVAPLDFPFTAGWVYLNLNLPTDASVGDVDFPIATAGNLAQSFVTAESSALGLYTVGLQAIELTSACEDLSPLINVLPNVIPYY